MLRNPNAFRTLAVALVAALSFLSAACRSSVVPIPARFVRAERTERETRFLDAFHQAYAARYDDALAAIDALAAEDPSDPSADLARAHVQCLRALLSGEVSEDDPNVRSMEAAALSALEKAEARLAENPDDAHALRLRGYARSYVARVHVITGSTLKAVWQAQGGAADLAASLRAGGQSAGEADPYLFLGFFHYMAGLSPGLVRAVGSVLNLTADCDLGRAEIEHAAEHGFLYRDEAKLTLALVSLLDREADYARSLAILRDMRRRFPENPGFALVLSMAERRVEDYDAAESTLRAVLAFDPESTPEPIRLGSRVVLAGLLAEMNRFEESEAMVRELLLAEGASAERIRARLFVGLGQLAERRGDRASAESAYREAEAAIPKALRWDQEQLKRDVKARLEKPMTTDEIELKFILGEELRGDSAAALARADALSERLAAEGRTESEAGAETRYRRGRALLKLGRVSEAETDLRFAAASAEATPRVRGQARFELGRALFEAGRRREGQKELSSLVDADTDTADVRSRSLARHYLLSPAAATPSGAVLLSPGRGPDNR